MDLSHDLIALQMDSTALQYADRGDTSNTRESIRRQIYFAARKLWRMFISLLAPKVIMGKAIVGLLSVWVETFGG